MLIHHCTSQGDLHPSVRLSVCERSGECLRERVNTSGCGADTDKQIAAHTSLGAHLQTAAGNLFTSVAPIGLASAYLCPPHQTCALGKLTSHAVMNLPIISSHMPFHDLFLAIVTSGFGKNKPKNLWYLSHGKLSQAYPFSDSSDATYPFQLSPEILESSFDKDKIPPYIGPKVMALQCVNLS